jgi:hypothetical protein
VKPGGIAWAQVRQFAEAGCNEEDIVAALAISSETLNDPETLARFQGMVKRGNALARILLQESIAKRGTRTIKGAGSVNALALRARNLLAWDKGLEEQVPPPDQRGAHAALRNTLERLAAVKTQEYGRLVTPAHILISLAYPEIDQQKIAGIDVAKLLDFVAGETPAGKVQ